MSLKTEMFRNLLALTPVNIPFNMVVCLPALIIPLGVNPSVISTASLGEKDLVTTSDQLTLATDEPLMITQRQGQHYLIQATVPKSNFRFFSQFKGVSITGALQTMVNAMYQYFNDNMCILISNFGVAGFDGLLKIQEVQIQDGFDQERPENSSEVIKLNFKLSVQPPKPAKDGGSAPTASTAVMRSIDSFIP